MNWRAAEQGLCSTGPSNLSLCLEDRVSTSISSRLWASTTNFLDSLIVFKLLSHVQLLCDPHGLQLHRLIVFTLLSQRLLQFMSIGWWYHPTVPFAVMPFSPSINLSWHQVLSRSYFFCLMARMLDGSLSTCPFSRILRFDFIWGDDL